MKLAILGGGRAAWAYGSAWRRAGWPIAGVWLRDESKSRLAELLDAPRRSIDDLARDSDLLLIAVTDRAIGHIAARVPETRAVLFHASGSLNAVRGGFSLHPLKALPPVGEPSDLRDVLLVFEGTHREVAQRAAKKVGARFAEIVSEKKALYHAAAVFGSNYVAAVLDVAEHLIGIGGVRDDLVALAESAIANWRTHEGAQRFTGPAARGDAETVERHRAALAGEPQLAEIYALLGRWIAASRLAPDE